MTLTRRHMLAGAVACGAIGRAAPAAARAPLAGVQAPGFYRQKIGSFEVTSILDGYLDIEVKLFPSADAAEVARLQARNFLSPGPIRAPVNAFLVNTGDKTVLIDTGSANLLGPTVGKLAQNLAAAGVTPDQIDMVLITHLHPDHSNGLIDAQGKAVFANAELVVPEAEAAFWLDEGIMSRAPADFQPFFKMAQSAAKPYAGRMRKFSGGGDVSPGITPLALPGHTPGHTGYFVASGKDRLLVWGDICHAPLLQIAHPEWSIAFDSDPAQAAATRLRALDIAAADAIPVVGGHMPFMGAGRISKDGAAYRLTPSEWAAAL